MDQKAKLDHANAENESLRRQIAEVQQREAEARRQLEAIEAGAASSTRDGDVVELATLPGDALHHIVAFLMPPAFAMLAATSSQLRRALSNPDALAAVFNGVVVPAQLRLEDALRRLKMEQTLGSVFALHGEVGQLERALTAVRP